MRQLNWQTRLILVLIFISMAFYLINYVVFRDPSFMLRLVTLQLGFVPISTILITLFLNSLIARREKRNRLEKMNMVIGTFFDEVGTRLLDNVSAFNQNRDVLSQQLIINDSWSDKDFAAVQEQFRQAKHILKIQPVQFEELKILLAEKRDFILRLLENPNLLEHEAFTELLQAVTHLANELAYRKDLRHLPAADYAHLTSDTKRVYLSLVAVWILFMQHLKNSYPYLFSLAVRTNPLDVNASVEIFEST